jgi:hypothetical protein
LENVFGSSPFKVKDEESVGAKTKTAAKDAKRTVKYELRSEIKEENKFSK